MKQLPPLNWLKVFEAAARMESFSKAARDLHMSPSAVSQQVSALEAHFGKALFERAGKGVQLSDAGKAFFPVVRQSLESIQVASSSLFDSDHLAPPSVQVNYISW